MIVSEIRSLFYPEQKVIIRLIYRNANPDKILYVGKFGELKNNEILCRVIGNMYTRDDGFLSISCVV